MKEPTEDQKKLTKLWWERLGCAHGQTEFLSVVKSLPTELSCKAVESLQDPRYDAMRASYFKGYKLGLGFAASTWIKEGLELWNADQTI